MRGRVKRSLSIGLCATVLLCGRVGFSGGSGVADPVAHSLARAIVYALYAGMLAAYSQSLSAKEFHATLRREFHPALPTLRFEGGYHRDLKNRHHAYTLNVTGGYLFLAGQVDWATYFQNPLNDLRVLSPRLLFRAAPNRFMEIDLALGAKVVRGVQHYTGFETGLPLYFFLGKHAIIDLQSYWTFVGGTPLIDGSIGITGKWKPIGLRAGYRVLDIKNTTLHGPTVGLVTQW